MLIPCGLAQAIPVMVKMRFQIFHGERNFIARNRGAKIEKEGFLDFLLLGRKPCAVSRHEDFEYFFPIGFFVCLFVCYAFVMRLLYIFLSGSSFSYDSDLAALRAPKQK